MSPRQILARSVVMLSASGAAGLLARLAGFRDGEQIVAIAVFVLIVSATLLFWRFRLAIAFIGIAILLGGNVLSLPELVEYSELDIILFLVGMMTLVGVLKDLGLFSWVIQFVISRPGMTGQRFAAILVFMSALMAGLVDEVTSIVFILALVFQVCDTLKIPPTPFVIIAVLGTNIGSSGTMLGNPVGILIGTKAGFSFDDFLVNATPITIIALVAAYVVVSLWYRREIHELTARLEARRMRQLGLGPLVKIPFVKGIAILSCAITIIALHYKIELWLGVEKNTILIVAPLAIAGLLMIWKNRRARHYIESEVEWWTLLFFMMLFAVAGSLETSGVTEQLASDVKGAFGDDPLALTPFVILITALGSAFVDNIVFVAAFIPVVAELNAEPLWWAMLFGACFGGNITLIGSTANIVALGMMEKRYRRHVAFLEWFKIGALVGLLTGVIAWIGILVYSWFG